MNEFLLGWAAFGGPAMFFLVWAVLASEQAGKAATELPRAGPSERLVRGPDGRQRLYRRPAWWEGWGWTADEADAHARTLADEFVEGPDEPEPPRSQPYR